MVQLGLLYDSDWLQFPFPAGACVSLMLPRCALHPSVTPTCRQPHRRLGTPSGTPLGLVGRPAAWQGDITGKPATG